MAIRFNFSEFGYKLLIFIENESAALNSELNVTIHVFFFDNIKELTHHFVRIAQQFKLKAEFADKFAMRRNCIS